ncbi:alpha/beta fold hydrolase [Salinilacihabitans rarus]|uniref:alpha/beta fold hydrolase n=1 Tax=Salinilacihabitans rarus TaxID=2961596 RepID=UPI0020C8D6EA|nr:alpha/beta hydrolase [Salinilacihabitans rarus]
MVRDDTLAGVDSRLVGTDRLETHVLASGDPDGAPAVFLHGTVSSSRFFEDALAALSGEYRAIAPDLRGYGDSETKPVDATAGLGDFVADLEALLTALGVDGPATLVGWSTGGGVALSYATERPAAVSSLVLVNPVSPYGFGGTKDVEGTPSAPDYAGSGGGIANREFASGLNHRVADGPGEATPRTVLREFYVDDGYAFDPDREESYLTGMLDTAVGDDNYPGTAVASDHWPGVAPGERGVNNAISPKYCDLSGIVDVDPKPPVRWLRGATDAVVANESLLDLGTLGRMGHVPDWPGEDVFPPQPMVDQTRAVLDDYADAGGEYEEVVLDGVGHTPHVEDAAAFVESVEEVLAG